MITDQDYDNSGAVPGSEKLSAMWQAAAAAFRGEIGARARLGLAYGATERERADLFLPEGRPEGLVLFVHGGYWRSRHRHDWSHLAQGALARGQAVAMPSYTLAPEARISQITLQIAQAVAMLATEVPDVPVRLAGHSAGGHLVARMLCADVMLPAEVAGRLARVVAISPLGDLRPLPELSMNADLNLDPAEAAAESPTLLVPALDVPMTVWVGGAELPAFLDQARDLARAWKAELVEEPGRHHFDVIDGLARPDSLLTDALLS